MIKSLLILQLNYIFVFPDDFPIPEDKLLVREIWIIDMGELLATNTAGAATAAGWSTGEVDKRQKSTNKIVKRITGYAEQNGG